MKKVANLQDKLVNIFKNNLFLTIIWVLVVFLSSIITITNGLTILHNYYKATVTEKKTYYKMLDTLVPGLQIDYFYNILGSPAIIKPNIENTKKEYIFVNKFFYLQAVTKNDGYVLSVAVTSRDKSFKPVFKAHGYTDILSRQSSESYNFLLAYKQSVKKGKGIILNETVFTDIVPQKDLLGSRVICRARIGAHRFSYSEEIYLANPGNYQTIMLVLNDAGNDGVSNYYSEMFDTFFVKMSPQEACEKVPLGHRKNTSINTFIITAPFITGEDIKDFSFGADLTDVRVFDYSRPLMKVPTNFHTASQGFC